MSANSLDAQSHIAQNATHNAESNTEAADAELCGMTHLASGRVCLLPARHADGCDFREENDVESAINLRSDAPPS
jgi:hypothetical protein